MSYQIVEVESDSGIHYPAYRVEVFYGLFLLLSKDQVDSGEISIEAEISALMESLP